MLLFWGRLLLRGEMSRTRLIFDRYWSLAAAIVLPVFEFFAEVAARGFGGYYEVIRAVLAVFCLTLLVHSWFMQRKYGKNRWRLGFFTLLLSLPALGCLWLELNVLRYHAHPMNWNKWELWQAICEWQYRVERTAQVLGIAVAFWVIGDSVRWMWKRHAASSRREPSKVAQGRV